MSSWRYFDRSEFTCLCGCGTHGVQDRFVDLLDELRARVGFPLVVSSGYRCPEHNERVSSTGRDGPHTTGLAADLAVNGQEAYAVLQHAFALGFAGIGVKQHGPQRFIHLDGLVHAPRPNVWSYA